MKQKQEDAKENNNNKHDTHQAFYLNLIQFFISLKAHTHNK